MMDSQKIDQGIAGCLHFNENVILALLALHILAVRFYMLAEKETLVSPMITGRKPWINPMESQIQTPPAWVALSIALLSAAAVYLLVR